VKRVAFVVAGFLAGAIIALQVPSSAQSPGTDQPQQRTITVTGSAQLSVAPDEAVVSLGVRTQAQGAQDALDQNNAKMQRVLDALRTLGLGDADLATSNIDLSPRYDNNGQTIVGYDASNTVEATVHDLSKVGRVIDSGVAAGANIAGGISFRTSDSNKGVANALANAVTDAKTKADAMAAAADAAVGNVLTINEQGPNQPQPYFAERVAYAAADSSVPVETPTIEREVTVTVTWQLA
jgi:uncharacterized protein YggE